jgi:hypothetical protein
MMRRSEFRLALHFELLDECSKMRRDRSRERVVLGLEGLPERRQPSASIASKHRPMRPVNPR